MDIRLCSNFCSTKEVLNSSQLLAYVYGPNLTIIIAGDASVYGIGSVISHILSNGSEKPIAFSSWTISAGKNNYGQLENEALSLMFVC